MFEKKKKKVDGIRRGEVSKFPGHIFVRSGDVALTRALLKRGAIRVLSKRGKRTQQIGVAALAEWIEQAKEEVAATEGTRAIARERGRVARAAKEKDYRFDFAQAVRRLYPSIPASDLEAVVTRACEVSSGRVGRSAAAKALANEPVKLAVQAHIRHAHTDYDRRLRRSGLGQRFGRASKDDRVRARQAIKKTVAAKAAEWSRPAGSPPLPSGALPVASSSDGIAESTETTSLAGSSNGAVRAGDAAPFAGSNEGVLKAGDAKAPDGAARAGDDRRLDGSLNTRASSSSKPTQAAAPAPTVAPSGSQGGLFGAMPEAPAPAPVVATPVAKFRPRETRPRFEQGSLWQRPIG